MRGAVRSDVCSPAKSGEGGGAGIGPPKMGGLVICRDSCRGSDVLRGGTSSFPVCLSKPVWRSRGTWRPQEGVVLSSTGPGCWLATCDQPGGSLGRYSH